MSSKPLLISSPRNWWRIALYAVLVIAGVIVASILIWQGITASGNPDPTAAHISHGAAIVDTGVLVFREGLECILVLSAITASMMGSNKSFRRPIAAGGSVGFIASIVTWFIVVGILSSLAQSVSALNVQAGTGLLAIVVLVVIMNWFFHKIYWTGWISLHNRKKKELLKEAHSSSAGAQSRLFGGLALLGFSSVYREGFEIVLFLQSLRLQVGSLIVLEGILIGLACTVVVGILTFMAHRHLPYKKMLVLTGVLLGVVLLVMVGEEAQEMQLAHWISTTTIPWLVPVIPDWMGLWFSVFPNVESLLAQFIAAVLVIGSFAWVRYQAGWRPFGRAKWVAQRPETPPQADDVALANNTPVHSHS
jgi:high-affinity iron transporter